MLWAESSLPLTALPLIGVELKVKKFNASLIQIPFERSMLREMISFANNTKLSPLVNMNFIVDDQGSHWQISTSRPTPLRGMEDSK